MSGLLSWKGEKKEGKRHKGRGRVRERDKRGERRKYSERACESSGRVRDQKKRLKGEKLVQRDAWEREERR